MKNRQTLKTMIFVLAMMVIAMRETVAANPITGLLERIDKGASRKFKIELLKNDGKEFFELDQQGQKVVVRGHNWVDVAVGINWYLKYHAGIHLTWNQMQAKLPDVLPPVKTREKHETNLSLRYDFNYCTFSYSMAFWDWKRWEREIDWMALHGVNLPLAIVGEDAAYGPFLEVGKLIFGIAGEEELNPLDGVCLQIETMFLPFGVAHRCIDWC